jgi:hypothetical protein
MFTEEEARRKWCPYANVYVAYNSTGAAGNRGLAADGGVQGNRKQALCIASDCMAWREGVWDHQRNLKPEDRTPRVGYCGAFGAVGGSRDG